jgi:uncharacterized OB-fold protein
MALKNVPPMRMTDPGADDWTQGFWDAAANEQLVVTKCSKCGTMRMPPGRFCRNCNSQEFAWESLPGTGTVFTCTVVRNGPEGAYAPAVIDADGATDARFVSAVVDCDPDDVKPGMKVKVVWNKVSDTLTMPYWAPA